jgi:hypothetical protein
MPEVMESTFITGGASLFAPAVVLGVLGALVIVLGGMMSSFLSLSVSSSVVASSSSSSSSSLSSSSSSSSSSSKLSVVDAAAKAVRAASLVSLWEWVRAKNTKQTYQL